MVLYLTTSFTVATPGQIGGAHGYAGLNVAMNAAKSMHATMVRCYIVVVLFVFQFAT